MPALREVPISKSVSLAAYDVLMSRQVAKLRNTARRCADLPIIHINSTGLRGAGGVSEILHSQIPLEQDLGLNSRWFELNNMPTAFFEITKKMHNLLQGRAGILSEDEKALYQSVNTELASHLPDILPTDRLCAVVIHDPQPAPLVAALPANALSILRLHIDLSTPNPGVLEFLRPFVQQAGRVVVSNQAYLASMPWLEPKQTVISYPAIDPFTEKNRPMPADRAHAVLNEFGINPDFPLIAQVSRFDPWKDPLGVIRAYYLAKRDISNLQLLLAGLILAKDDPEAASVFDEVRRHAAGDPDIFLFADPTHLQEVSNDVFINAVYTASTVIIQKSIREGFGMTMTEAMWKGKAVVAGNTAGAAVQIEDGKTGVIIASPEEAAAAIVRLINDNKARVQLGRAAYKTVKDRFLMPRLLEDFLKLYAHTAEEGRL